MRRILRRRILRAAALITIVGFPASPAGAQATFSARAVDLGGLETRSAALMLSAQEAGDLQVSAVAIPLPGGPGSSRVILVVDVDGRSLLDGIPSRSPATDDGTGHDLLITEIYAYAVDAGGSLKSTLTRAFRLDLEHYRPRLAAGGIKFLGHLDLAPGDYSLRILVLHRRADRLGLEIMPLTVPTWSSDATPALLPPLPREPVGSWILVEEEGEDPPPFPVTIAGEPWVPATRWQVDAGSRIDYLLLGRELGRSLSARLLDEEGAELLEVGLGNLQPVADGPTDLEALAAELDTTGLGAGRYQLRIASAAGASASAQLAIRSPRDSGPLASEPRAAATGMRATLRRSSDRRPGGRRASLDRVRSAYRQAAGALSSGDRPAAVRSLIELERSEIGDGSTRVQKRLAEGELLAARELATADAEALLPLIRLHEGLYREYHRHHRYLLSTHSRQILAQLSRLYLERRGSPQARHLVACSLVSVAGYLHETGALPAAADFYEQAREHQPDHPAALIGLATIHESYSDYAGAAELLKRLNEAEPANLQVRLRLAVNLRRLKKIRRAEELLRELVATPDPGWVGAVAAQELASLHAAERRLGQAVSVLEGAVDRHPRVQRLRLQLASLLDRSGRPAEALAVLDALDPTTGREVGSPRLRYSTMPTAALVAARQALAEEVDRRLPILGHATRGDDPSLPDAETE